MAVLVVACAAAIVIAGGMRSLTWSSVAQAHRRAAGAGGAGHHRRRHDLQPAAAADDARQRPARPVARGDGPQRCRSCWPRLAFDLPGDGIEPLVKRFAPGVRQRRQPRASSSCRSWWRPASPPRRRCCRARAPRPASTRRASRCGWAVLVVGRRAADAAGGRGLPALVRARSGRRPCRRIACRCGSSCCSRPASPASTPRRSWCGLSSIGFERDAVLFALPIAAGLPQVIVYLALAGALAAALAALAASLMASRRHPVGGCRARPAERDGTGQRPRRHGAPRPAGRRLRHGLAGDRRAGRSAAAVPVVADASARRPPSRCCCCRSGGSAPMPGGRWPAWSTGFAVTMFMMLLSEIGAIDAAERAGRRRRPAAGDRRRRRRQPDDAGAGAARARHRCARCACRAARRSTTARCACSASRTARPP